MDSRLILPSVRTGIKMAQTRLHISGVFDLFIRQSNKQNCNYIFDWCETILESEERLSTADCLLRVNSRQQTADKTDRELLIEAVCKWSSTLIAWNRKRVKSLFLMSPDLTPLFIDQLAYFLLT